MSFRAKTIVAFGVVYVVWGSTYLGIKVALNEGMPPALLGGVRLLIAGMLLLGFARLRGSRLRISRHDLSTSAIVGLCLLCGGMFSTMLSEQLIDSTLAAIVVAAAPLWMALAEGVLPGMDRPSRQGVSGSTAPSRPGTRCSSPVRSSRALRRGSGSSRRRASPPPASGRPSTSQS